MQLAGDPVCAYKPTTLPVRLSAISPQTQTISPTEGLARLCLLFRFCASPKEDNHRKEIHLFIISVFHVYTHPHIFPSRRKNTSPFSVQLKLDSFFTTSCFQLPGFPVQFVQIFRLSDCRQASSQHPLQQSSDGLIVNCV